MDDGTDLPTDVLVCILQRVQPNGRRRLRLVCGHWRQVIDTRTAMRMRSRAKTLIVTAERACVIDDLSTGRCEELTLGTGHMRDTQVIGTCNGIICLCDYYGCITLLNPVTRDKLVVPRMPYHATRILPHTYSFTYDQATGRYMVVHVDPCYFDRVRVFTLGEASWRDVHTHGWRCDPKDGFVTVGGSMYGIVYLAVKGETAKVISFDLDNKRAPSVIPLPSPTPAGACRLTEVLGTLGIAFSCFSGRMDKMEVWVMEHGASAEAKHARWSCWYSVRVARPQHQPRWHDHQHLTRPHFAHGINHVLTWEWLSTGGGCALYRHAVSNTTAKARHGTVEISQSNQGMLVAHIKTDYDTFNTFDYVETMEPLSIYKNW